MKTDPSSEVMPLTKRCPYMPTILTVVVCLHAMGYLSVKDIRMICVRYCTMLDTTYKSSPCI